MPPDDTAIHRPTVEAIAEIAAERGLTLDDSRLSDYGRLVNATLETIEELYAPDGDSIRPDVHPADRPTGYRPGPDEDLHNAWITRCRVEGAADGPLAGMAVGLKDNIALAGYPLTAGSAVLEGFVPEIDATVVRRLLDAGATITGKNNMESLAHSGAGDVSDFGTVTNPHDDRYLAGGSSSGCAAAVATGECDLAIGTDQMGSVRIPASWCGIVGLKPTFGLIPYTGTIPLEPSFDHLGPMARTVKDVAIALEALAGEDIRDGVSMDSRQPRGIESEPYAADLQREVEGMTVGVLDEGFGWEFGDPAVDEAVRDAVARFEDLGAEITSASAPLHRRGLPICIAQVIQGADRIREEDGIGTTHRGWQWSDLARTLREYTRTRADRLPPTVVAATITAVHLRREHGIEPYARARNLANAAARGYDRHLASCDVLVLPTTPIGPYERDESTDHVDKRLGRPPIAANTGLFDLTGHPAISVPCATAHGLPVGVMLVGSRFNERRLLQVADAFENAVDWSSR